MNWGKLLRIYTMIAAVSAVSLLVFASQFSDTLLSILSVTVGTIAFVSVILGALLSADIYLSETSTGQVSASQERQEDPS